MSLTCSLTRNHCPARHSGSSLLKKYLNKFLATATGPRGFGLCLSLPSSFYPSLISSKLAPALGPLHELFPLPSTHVSRFSPT